MSYLCHHFSYKWWYRFRPQTVACIETEVCGEQGQAICKECDMACSLLWQLRFFELTGLPYTLGSSDYTQLFGTLLDLDIPLWYGELKIGLNHVAYLSSRASFYSTLKKICGKV